MTSSKRRRRDLQAEFKRRDLSQKAIAEALGVTPDHFSDVMNGRASLTERLARDISRATGIPLDEVKGATDGAGSNGV